MGRTICQAPYTTFLIFFVVGAIRLENQLGFHARRLVEVIAFAPVHGLGQCSIGVRV